MLYDTFVMTIFRQNCHQPSAGKKSWADIFILSSTVDMLCYANIEGDMADDTGDTRVAIGSGDLFSLTTKLNQALKQDLDHWIQAWSSPPSNIFNAMASECALSSTE